MSRISIHFISFVFRLHFQRENGLMQRELARGIAKKPICENNANKVTSVGLVEIKAALFIFIIGHSAALLIFLVEMTVKKISKNFF